MGVVDRTDEFRHIIRELSSKGAVPGYEGVDGAAVPQQMQSELNTMSGQIGSEIHQASLKVQELRKMARAKGIFNDKTNDIQSLTFSVKQDITLLEQKIEMLSEKFRGSGSNKSYQAHSSNMVETLRTRLLEVTADFKSALEDRTKSLEQQEKRRTMYQSSASRGADPFANRQSMAPRGDAADLEGGGSGGGQQAQTMQYHTSRAEAVQSVQKTIGELAQMFQKMAVMVTAQEDMIRRIDHDVDDTLDNLQQGQDSLLKYFHQISSNRMLIIKVFLILIFFVVFFVVFLA